MIPELLINGITSGNSGVKVVRIKEMTEVPTKLKPAKFDEGWIIGSIPEGSGVMIVHASAIYILEKYFAKAVPALEELCGQPIKKAILKLGTSYIGRCKVYGERSSE